MTAAKSTDAHPEDELWFVQYCLYGTKKGMMAVIHAEEAIRSNIAEARKRVPMNYWVTVGWARTQQEARALRTQLMRTCRTPSEDE